LATDIEYGVALISRLLKITGLFCKRASKRKASFLKKTALLSQKRSSISMVLLQKRPMILRSLLIETTPYSISVASSLLKKEEGLLPQKDSSTFEKRQLYINGSFAFPTVLLLFQKICSTFSKKGALFSQKAKAALLSQKGTFTVIFV